MPKLAQLWEDGGQMVGVFSERDVMLRVVAAEKDPEQTKVAAVMTARVERVIEDTEDSDAIELMVRRHIRHLPIVDSRDRLVGLISVRNLLQNHVEDLDRQLNALEAYFTADGPGG